jgi:hypothetical protein
MGFGRMGMPPLAFADKVRTMSEEEYNSFTAKMQEGRYGNSRHRQPNN